MMILHAKGLLRVFITICIVDATFLHASQYCKTCVHINSYLLSWAKMNLKFKFGCTNDSNHRKDGICLKIKIKIKLWVAKDENAFRRLQSHSFWRRMRLITSLVELSKNFNRNKCTTLKYIKFRSRRDFLQISQNSTKKGSINVADPKNKTKKKKQIHRRPVSSRTHFNSKCI